MSIVTRFLRLCTMLALPGLAAAQPPLAIERLWLQDATGNTKTAFAPGETIQFAAQLNNTYGGDPLSVELTITTPFYNNTKTLDIAPGRNISIWNASAPTKQDNYTVTIKALNSFYHVWAMSSASFSVLSLPKLSSGWYKGGGKNGAPSIIYEDNTGLQIVWGNSYVYRYSGENPLYWYTEVQYLNTGSKTLSISCIGQTDPSIIKAHMRGTAQSGSVNAEETFCSRNPSFNGSIKPGGIHYEWAIFRNALRKGGEMCLELSEYGKVSPWIDPWYYSFIAPPPGECPHELVVNDACQSGPVLMRLP